MGKDSHGSFQESKTERSWDEVYRNSSALSSWSLYACGAYPSRTGVVLFIVSLSISCIAFAPGFQLIYNKQVGTWSLATIVVLFQTGRMFQIIAQICLRQFTFQHGKVLFSSSLDEHYSRPLLRGKVVAVFGLTLLQCFAVATNGIKMRLANSNTAAALWATVASRKCQEASWFYLA